MPSTMRTPIGRQKPNGKNKRGRVKSMKLPKVIKVKAKHRSQKELEGQEYSEIHHCKTYSVPDSSNRQSPKPEARSCVADGFLLAMMTTKYKPTWRHATWNSIDYMLCTRHRTAEEAPCMFFRPQHRVALYGHHAKSMKNFILHFDCENQCASLDRMWFGEAWFPVEKYVREIQPSRT